MTKYNCVNCNFHTDRKNDYSRHIKSTKHLQKEQEKIEESKLNPIKIQPESKNKNECMYCKNTYSTQSNLSKHMKKCANKVVIEKDNIIHEKDNIIKDNEVKTLKEKLELVQKQLTIYEKMLQSFTTPQTINYYNYISSSFPNPKLLDSNKSYKNLLEAKTMTLIEVIVMYHSNGKLANFVGDYIIKNYKKEPKDQAMWGTDVSRLNFIISESCKDNINIWSYDKKAVKIKKIVIEPALQYIKNELYEFCQENSMATDEPELSQLKASVEIMTIINNGSLSNDIAKYIAPEFAIVMSNDQPMIKV